MRDILFRGKRIDNGNWVEGCLIKRKYYVETTYYIGFIEMTSLTKVEVIPETVCQYVGITDKNSKKIFENDVVKTKYGRLCQVVWASSPYYQCWDMIGLESKHQVPDWRDIWYKNNLEVVGNIYDNPRLVESDETI
jgi:YopX protein.